MIADLRRNAPLFWSTGGHLQEPDELPGVCKRLDLEHGLDQPILPPLRHRGAGQLAEFLHDVLGWRERVLAAARRLTRLGKRGAVLQLDVNLYHMAEAGPTRRDLRVLDYLDFPRQLDAGAVVDRSL